MILTLNCLKKQYVSKSCRTNCVVMVRKALPKCPTSAWLLESLEGEKTNSWWILFKFFYTQNNSRTALLSWQGVSSHLPGPQVWVQLPDFCIQSSKLWDTSGGCAALSLRGGPCQGKKEPVQKNTVGMYLPCTTKPLSQTGFQPFLCHIFRGCAGTIWEITPGAVLLRTNRSSEHSQDIAERRREIKKQNSAVKLCRQRLSKSRQHFYCCLQ